MHHQLSYDLLLKPQLVPPFLPISTFPPLSAKYSTTRTYIRQRTSKQPSSQLNWKPPDYWTLSNISNQQHHTAFTFKPPGAFRLPHRLYLLIGNLTAAPLHHLISAMPLLCIPSLRPERPYPSQSRYPLCTANCIHPVRSPHGSFLQYILHSQFLPFRRMFLRRGGRVWAVVSPAARHGAC